MPQDVFAALEDIEFPFLREALEAEFKSMSFSISISIDIHVPPFPHLASFVQDLSR